MPEDTGLSGPVTGTLSVHDADVGDALTGVVVGNATFEYNGSTTIPGGIDISALLKAANVTFDTASSNGATVDLHWTYQPLMPISASCMTATSSRSSTSQRSVTVTAMPEPRS